MIGLIITILVDSSFVKVYDLIDKFFIPIHEKKVLFSINAAFSILLQYLILRHIKSVFKESKNQLNIHRYDKAITVSLLAISLLFIVLIYQLFLNNYFSSILVILIVTISYGMASSFLISLSLLFLSWYRTKRDFIIFLYLLSVLIIAFNLVVTTIYTDLNITERPQQVREFVGGSMDIVAHKYALLNTIYKASSVASFISIWLTTAVLLTRYKSRLLNTLVYSVILSLPLIYFLFNYIYQYVFGDLLINYLIIDPITVSIILTTFLTLSKPVGGFTFGIVFWKIANSLKYERNIKKHLVFSGLGIFLLFSTNQAIGQSLIPYPPFGLVTVTVLILAAAMTTLGIFNAATSVSTNNMLLNSIHKQALEIHLLDSIGRAEKDRMIQKTVDKIIHNKKFITSHQSKEIDIDRQELKKYIDSLIEEIRKSKTVDNSK